MKTKEGQQKDKTKEGQQRDKTRERQRKDDAEEQQRKEKPEEEKMNDKEEHKQQAESEELTRIVEYLIWLRTTSLCFQKQCQAPIGEVTVLLSIQQMFRQKLPVHVSGLGEKLNLSRPAISRMLRVLREKGYIVLHPGKKDHRYTYIELTQPGTQIIRKEQEQCLSLLRKVSDRMGQENMNHFLHYNRQFYSILSEEVAHL